MSLTYQFKVSSYDNTNGWTTQDFTNYVVGNNPFTGFSDVESRITGQLNSGYLEFVNNNVDNLPMFDIVTIIVTDDVYSQTKSFYIGSDKTEVVDKENNLVLHRVELVDLTKKLEKYTLETKTYTQLAGLNNPRITILEGINILLAITKLQRDVVYSGLDDLPNDLGIIISDNIKFLTNNVELPQMVLSNLTLREAINELLKPINAICYLDFNLTNHTFTLNCERYNALKFLIENDSIDSLRQEQSVDDYSSEIDNFVKNQITESVDLGIASWFPSEVALGYARTRQTDYELTDSNFGILLPNNVYTMQELDFACRYSILNSDSGTYIIQNQQSLVNVTDCVVDSEQYQAIPYSTDVSFNRTLANTLYYTYNNDFINLSNTYKSFLFTRYAWKGALLVSLVKQIQTSLWGLNDGESGDFVVSTYDYKTGTHNLCDISINVTRTGNNYTYGVNGAGASGTANDDIDYLRYRVSYIPIYNTRMKTQKDDTSQVKKITSGFSNQKAKIISLQNIGIADKSQLERIGNQNYSITIRHKTLNSLYGNGNYTSDGYIITKSEYIYYDNCIVGKYDLTKNYQKLSEYIGINSEYRPYDIPNGKNVFERTCLFNSFAYVKTYRKAMDTTNTILGSNALHCVGNTFSRNTNTNITINGVVIDIDYLSTKWNSLVNGKNKLYLQCQSDGSANNLLFTFNFIDNIASGYFITNDDGKKLMNKVPYTNDYGTFDNLSVTYVNSFANFDMKDQPLVSANNNFNVASLSDLFICKDASEIIQFVYELSFINYDSDRIVLGKDFAKYNQLVYKYYKSFNLYGTNDKYNKSDLEVKGTLIGALNTSNVTSTIGAGSYEHITFDNSLVGDYKWYAIGDSATNDFLIAFDKDTLQNGLYIVFSDERIDIDKTY